MKGSEFRVQRFGKMIGQGAKGCAGDPAKGVPDIIAMSLDRRHGDAGQHSAHPWRNAPPGGDKGNGIRACVSFDFESTQRLVRGLIR